MKQVAIANDHAGTLLKKGIIEFLEECGYEIINFGTDSEEPVDYPDYVKPIAESVESKTVDFGILICGTGQGFSIAANKISGIRAALCWNK